MRPYCEACQTPVYFDPKVAVVVFIQRDERVLLIQRAVDPGKGKWRCRPVLSTMMKRRKRPPFVKRWKKQISMRKLRNCWRFS